MGCTLHFYKKLMEELRKDIQADFKYSISTYSPKNSIPGAYLSEYDVMKAHYYLSDYFLSEGEEVRFGILNYDMLSSAVYRQTVSFGDVEKWKQPIEKFATLLYGLTKDHAFNDGNKRTAFLCLLMGLHRINRKINCGHKDFEKLLVRIASNNLGLYKSYKSYEKYDDPEVRFIADFIRRNSKKIDTQFHSITYAGFNQRLKQFDVWMDNPQGNTINVYRKTTKKSFWGLHSKSQDERIIQIGFKGWKKQINPKALKSVLQAAHLTAEFGVDSNVFFYDDEPEYKLVEDYYPILKRLKDK